MLLQSRSQYQSGYLMSSQNDNLPPGNQQCQKFMDEDAPPTASMNDIPHQVLMDANPLQFQPWPSAFDGSNFPRRLQQSQPHTLSQQPPQSQQPFFVIDWIQGCRGCAVCCEEEWGGAWQELDGWCQVGTHVRRSPVKPTPPSYPTAGTPSLNVGTPAFSMPIKLAPSTSAFKCSRSKTSKPQGQSQTQVQKGWGLKLPVVSASVSPPVIGGSSPAMTTGGMNAEAGMPNKGVLGNSNCMTDTAPTPTPTPSTSNYHQYGWTC
ncbi:hypothetical protein L208DRAFT_1382884 [Tricholoma matsutake]|nr:hypothetical protein L208DRAFT_1382884 [Tricholoma matsutake 945]